MKQVRQIVTVVVEATWASWQAANLVRDVLLHPVRVFPVHSHAYLVVANNFRCAAALL